jgi:acyl-CoA thioesterase-1
MQIQALQDCLARAGGGGGGGSGAPMPLLAIPGTPSAARPIPLHPAAAVFVTLNPAGKGYGGRSRLPALLKRHQPSHVVIELGGNDALRGLPMAMTQGNLLDMSKQAQAAGAQVLLLGMQMPPNYGPDMARQFEAAYAQVAKSQKAALVPFFLKGVGDDPEPLKWFQADRIHPNEAAQPRLLANVWPILKKQLK